MKRATLDVSKWSLLQHREARALPPAADDDARESLLQDEVFERLYAGDDDLSPLAAEARSEHADWAQRAHDAATALPDFARLSAVARGDADMAACATETMAALLEPTLRQQEREAEAARKAGRPAPKDQDGALRRALRGAVAAAGKACDEYTDAREALVGLGAGKARGEHGEGAGPRYHEIAAMLRDDGRLRRILALAGRLKAVAAKKQRERTDLSPDEITDVEQGDNLGRLLPAELARLSHPLLRRAFLRDWSEKRCLQYHLEGKAEKGAGPIVVCLDKSGSMMGESDEWATAVAIALLSVAVREKRVFALLCYEYGITHEVVVPVGGTLPMDALSVGCGGGTDTDSAFRRALDIIEQHPGQIAKADVIIVSDGCDRSRDEALRPRAKALGVTSYGIGIGGTANDLLPWCDEVVSAYDLQHCDVAVQKVFTV